MVAIDKAKNISLTENMFEEKSQSVKNKANNPSVPHEYIISCESEECLKTQRNINIYIWGPVLLLLIAFTVAGVVQLKFNGSNIGSSKGNYIYRN